MREPTQIARRALVMGSLSMRASLEVTDHSRASVVAQQILPWLEELGIASELDPIEREILEKSYGDLRSEQRVDSYWAGEGAAVLSWVLSLAEKPPQSQAADHQAIMRVLCFMQPGAEEILSSPFIRPIDEVESYCKEIGAMRGVLQMARVRGTEAEVATLKSILRRRYAELGLEIGDVDFENANGQLNRMTDEERQSLPGLLFVRDNVGTWLFDARARFFSND